MKIAGKVQVDVFHRHHLGITAAGGAAFYAKTRPQGRLAQRDHYFFPYFMEALSQTYGRGRFSLPGRRRGDRRNKD